MDLAASSGLQDRPVIARAPAMMDRCEHVQPTLRARPPAMVVHQELGKVVRPASIWIVRVVVARPAV